MKPDLIDIEKEFKRHLKDGERLLWTGKPKYGFIFNAAYIPQLLFGSFFAGFAIFWMFIANNTGGSFMVFFGIPFVLAGLYMAFGNPIRAVILRQNTVYGLSNLRVIRKSGITSVQTLLLPIADLGELSLIEHRDGSGHIIFNSEKNTTRLRPNVLTNSFSSYEHLKDVHHVYDLLTRQKSKIERNIETRTN